MSDNVWLTLDPGFFAPIWLGVGTLAVVALLLLDIGAQRRRREAIALFAAPSLMPGLTATLSGGRRLLKRMLLIAAVALLFVAMARPHMFFQWSEESRTGLDVLFAIDCSRSMLTEDAKPNRIERAKLAVEDFADEVPDNRLGLVAFAGDSFLECPLTLDHEAFLSAVRDLDTDTIPRPGTDIATAIDEAVVALKSQPNNLKFMILVTDGEDLEGRALEAAKSAAQAGLKIYTIGVGTPNGDVIPMRDDSGAVSFAHDSDGEIVHSKLDEDMLRQIALITGGAYEPLGQHGEGLSTIYNRYIATLPKQHLEERREKIRYEQFMWPLGLATLLLFWEFLIRDRSTRDPVEIVPPPSPGRPRPRRKTAAAATPASVALILALVWLGGVSGRAASSSDVAERDYKSGQFGSAEQKYQEAINTQPDRPDLQYDRGDAAYKAGEYNDAEEAFRKAMDTPNLNLQENSYYNLGNTQFKHGEAMEKVDQQRTQQLWEQALHSYESALKLKDSPDTRYNYDVVKRKLQQMKQQQQQQQQQNQQKNQQQQQQQNQNGQNQQNNQGQQQQQPNQSGQGKQMEGKSSKDQSQGQQQQGQQQQQQNNAGGQDQQQQQQSASDKDASAQERARSMERQQDQQDPGAKSREEAEALLDSLKDDEKRVTAASMNNGNQPPPTASGKDW